MIALALASIIASATLSISSPSEYFYTNPIETNMLTDVGMGKNPSADLPLSYTDKAFLLEAMTERRYFIYKPLCPLYYDTDCKINLDGISVYDTIFNQSGLTGYVGDNATNSMATTARIATHTNDITRLDALVWHDIFDGDPFFEKGITNVTELVHFGGVIGTNVIAKLYDDLGKMIRPAYYDNYASETNIETHSEKNLGSTYIISYDDINERFIYGNDIATISTNGSTSYVFSKGRTLKANKKKNVGWKQWYDEHGDVHYTRMTDPTQSYWRYEERFDNQPGSTVWVTNVISQVRFESNQTVSVVKAFGFGTFLHRKKIDMTVKSEEGGYFVIPINAFFSDGKILLQLGEEADMAIVRNVFNCFGAHYYSNLAELLNEIPDPPDPSLVDHSDDVRYSSEYNDSYNIQINRIYIVVEMDFNARVVDE